MGSNMGNNMKYNKNSDEPKESYYMMRKRLRESEGNPTINKSSKIDKLDMMGNNGPTIGVEKYTGGMKINGNILMVDKPAFTGYEYVVLSGRDSKGSSVEWKITILKMERRIAVGYVNNYEKVTRKSLEISAELYDVEKKGKWNASPLILDNSTSKLPTVIVGDSIKVKISKESGSMILSFNNKQEFQFKLSQPVSDIVYPVVIFHGMKDAAEIEI